ncbi:hypothetical protein LX77_02333 [Gelidibacter algens]|uniref:Uncharacterized protein n=1 Tax=Gelidibacter algens TaxID=49280 RepID=A0A327S0Z9_9FLAO|nr:hypothetical protein LX77_02333 [Gelidibacter algens]
METTRTIKRGLTYIKLVIHLSDLTEIINVFQSDKFNHRQDVLVKKILSLPKQRRCVSQMTISSATSLYSKSAFLSTLLKIV